MKKIIILMSTYNGGSFLDQQLESICSQKNMDEFDIKLVIRDDGSTDKTGDIILSWKDRLDIDLIKGENIGARNSFLELLMNAPASDYYAFCDQDDIWYDGKLSKAVDSMSESPQLYFSNVEYIDENSNRLGENLLSEDFELSLKRVMMCNPANGCTMVWNDAMQRIIRELDPEFYTMHDEFMLTSAMLFGSVIYDPVPSMGYRIHALNVTQSKGILKKLKMTSSIWFGRKQWSLDKRAKELLKHELREEDRQIILELAMYRKLFNRIRLIGKYRCEHAGIQRSFRLRMLLGVL